MRIKIIIIITIVSAAGLLALLFYASQNDVVIDYTPADEYANEVVLSSTTTETEPVSNSTTGQEDNLQVTTSTQSNNMNQPSNQADQTPATAVTPQTMPLTTNQQLMAWIYPYQPACAAQHEYSDGRKIDILKPEFFTINGGSLMLLDESMTQCNSYSPTFVASLKQHSSKQFVTISSASAEDMATFLQQALTVDTDIETLVNFVVDNELTGIELNFEDFGSWSEKNYSDFKTFVTRLGTALHKKNKKLMVVGPPIANAIEEAWFLWRYEDFTTLPIDHMVVMGYDYQFDHGAGKPVAPLDWLRDVITWVSARYPQNRLTIALPSYGYEGKHGTQQISILTHEQIKSRPGYNTATRDSRSAEMTWQYGDTVYFYQDSTSLEQKRNLVTSTGIQSISIWHLGGNLWFE